MSSYLFDSWIPGTALWVVMYVSDYACTIASARLYRSGANQHIVFEGSFELTPYFEKDIDALRRVSPRFIVALALFVCALVYIWFSTQWIPWLAPLYEVVLGSLILLQCMVHMRHFRNLHLFRSLQKDAGLRGRLEYPRPLILRASAAEGLSFATMYLLLAVAFASWFFLGGALSCLALWSKHRSLARQPTLRAK